VGRSYTSDPFEQDPFDFDLDGVKFVCTGTVTLLDVSDLATMAAEDISSVRGAAAVGEIFRAAFEDGYPVFAAHVRKYKTRPERLVEIMNDLIEYVSQGPTGPPSPSSHGRPTMNGSSVADYPWPGLAGKLDAQTRPPGQHMSDEQIDEIRRRLAGGV
jgi:hypothetical protein